MKISNASVNNTVHSANIYPKMETEVMHGRVASQPNDSQQYLKQERKKISALMPKIKSHVTFI